MNYPDALKQQAIQMRSEGLMIKEISGLLGVGENTVSSWVKDVVLEDKRPQAVQLWLAGKSVLQIARCLKVSDQTVYTWTREIRRLGTERSPNEIGAKEIAVLLGCSVVWVLQNFSDRFDLPPAWVFNKQPCTGQGGSMESGRRQGTGS